MNNLNDGLFGSFIAAKKIGVSLERLRYWENLGIVKPNFVQCRTRRFKRYSQEDINRAILVKNLVDKEKYTLEGAILKLNKKEESPKDNS